jgi:hypothetical protein
MHFAGIKGELGGLQRHDPAEMLVDVFCQQQRRHGGRIALHEGIPLGAF